MQKEITKIVRKVSKQTEEEEDMAGTSFTLDEQGLKDYILEVVDELKEKKSS